MQNEQDLRPLLTLQQNLLTEVTADGDALDNKAMAMAAINITLLIFVAQADLHLHHWWQSALLWLPYGLSIVFNIMTILPKPYIGASVDLASHPEYLELDKEDLVLQLLSDTQLAIDVNQQINKTYWRYWLTSLAATILGTVVLFAILIV